MLVKDVIESTDGVVVVRAPAYNKTGSQYAEQTVEIGEYTKANQPELSVANSNVLAVSSGMLRKIVVVADI